MADYIDRETLRKKMYHESFETDSDMQKWDSGCWIRYKLFENVIEGIPTADVKPVVRGEWRFSPDDSEGICTVCQHKIYGRPYQNIYLIVPYNFCPNCGADMRGADDDKTRP